MTDSSKTTKTSSSPAPAAGSTTEKQAGKTSATSLVDAAGTIAEAKTAGEEREKLKIEHDDKARIEAAGEQQAGQKDAELQALQSQQAVDEAVRQAGLGRLPSLGGPRLPEREQAEAEG